RQEDAEQAWHRWVGILVKVTYCGIIASGDQSVLGEVICTHGKEICVPCDLADGERRGGRFDHCAERRKVFDTHFVSDRHEQFSYLFHVTFEGDHRYEDANVLGLREPQQTFELRARKLRIVEQQPHTAFTEKRI